MTSQQEDVEMKSFFEFENQIYFFSKSVPELIATVQEQFFARMIVDKAIDDEEELKIESHTFPLWKFIDRKKSFLYTTKMPEFVSLEDKKFIPVDDTDTCSEKLIVLSLVYSFDKGDEPDYKFSYFSAESEAHFDEKFKEQALKDFHKKKTMIDLCGVLFCLDDYVHADKKEVRAFAPQVFLVK